MSEVDRTSVNVPIFGVPPARGNADEREAERQREREVWRRGLEDDDPRN